MRKCFRGIKEHWGCGEVFQGHLGVLVPVRSTFKTRRSSADEDCLSLCHFLWLCLTYMLSSSLLPHPPVLLSHSSLISTFILFFPFPAPTSQSNAAFDAVTRRSQRGGIQDLSLPVLTPHRNLHEDLRPYGPLMRWLKEMHLETFERLCQVCTCMRVYACTYVCTYVCMYVCIDV